MMVQKKVSSKKNTVLGVAAIIIMFATVVFLYFTVIRDTSSNPETVSATNLLIPVANLDTKFNTNIFKDSRVKNLKQYGPAIVEVTERGRKADPFEAF